MFDLIWAKANRVLVAPLTTLTPLEIAGVCEGVMAQSMRTFVTRERPA